VRFLERLAPFFGDAPHGAPNHVLVNEYRPGQGIMPHEDGAAYAPVVATVSLGGAAVLDLYAKDGGGGGKAPRWRVLQEPGSLLVTTGEAYECLRHGIEGREADEDLGAGTVANWELLGDRAAYEGGTNVRTTRVSLTYRDVLKVVKVPIGILGGRRP
jgi:alkylated DNA repair protein alkB family protein 6